MSENGGSGSQRQTDWLQQWKGTIEYVREKNNDSDNSTSERGRVMRRPSYHAEFVMFMATTSAVNGANSAVVSSTSET